MLIDFSMGGYGFYVWLSYAAAFAVLIFWLFFMPCCGEDESCS